MMSSVIQLKVNSLLLSAMYSTTRFGVPIPFSSKTPLLFLDYNVLLAFSEAKLKCPLYKRR